MNKGGVKSVEEKSLYSSLEAVVKCKDCKYGYEVNGGMMILCNHGVRADVHERDWFCADGEVKL